MKDNLEGKRTTKQITDMFKLRSDNQKTDVKTTQKEDISLENRATSLDKLGKIHYL